eukprot:RCo039310
MVLNHGAEHDVELALAVELEEHHHLRHRARRALHRAQVFDQPAAELPHPLRLGGRNLPLLHVVHVHLLCHTALIEGVLRVRVSVDVLPAVHHAQVGGPHRFNDLIPGETRANEPLQHAALTLGALIDEGLQLLASEELNGKLLIAHSEDRDSLHGGGGGNCSRNVDVRPQSAAVGIVGTVLLITQKAGERVLLSARVRVSNVDGYDGVLAAVGAPFKGVIDQLVVRHLLWAVAIQGAALVVVPDSREAMLVHHCLWDPNVLVLLVLLEDEVVQKAQRIVQSGIVVLHSAGASPPRFSYNPKNSQCAQTTIHITDTHTHKSTVTQSTAGESSVRQTPDTDQDLRNATHKHEKMI